MFDTISESDFRKRIKLGAPKGLPRKYFFFGDEDYLKSAALKLARTGVGADPDFDCARIDQTNFSPDALNEALSVPPMFGDVRYVELTVSLSELRQSEINSLAEIAAGIDDGPEFLIIVFPAGTFDPGYPKRPSALFKKMAEAAVPVSFERVTGARLNGWVSKHYSQNGVTADGPVCNDTIACCGTDMFRLASEIDKISYYVLASGRGRAERSDVLAAASRVVEFDSFAFANAVLAGDGAAALRILGVMKSKKEEPVKVMSEIVRVICDLQTVAVCRDGGMTPDRISAATGIKPYPLSKYLGALDRSGKGRVSALLDAAVEADEKIKSGTSGYLPIELLVCSV